MIVDVVVVGGENVQGKRSRLELAFRPLQSLSFHVSDSTTARLRETETSGKKMCINLYKSSLNSVFFLLHFIQAKIITAILMEYMNGEIIIIMCEISHTTNCTEWMANWRDLPAVRHTRVSPLLFHFYSRMSTNLNLDSFFSSLLLHWGAEKLWAVMKLYFV